MLNKNQRTAALVGLCKGEVSQDAAQPVLQHGVVLQRALQCGTEASGWQCIRDRNTARLLEATHRTNIG